MSAVIIAGMFLFFSNWKTQANTYPVNVTFTDASDLIKDAPVTLAGVQIGKVEEVTIDKRTLLALAKLKINKGPKWPLIPRGSRFLIQTPVLGASGTLAIVPPHGSAVQPADTLRTDGEPEVVRGDRPADLQASLQNATNLMGQLETTVNKVNMLLDRTTTVISGPQVQRTLNNVEGSSRNIQALTSQLSAILAKDNAQVERLLEQTQAGSKVAINNLTDTTATFKSITAENKDSINEIVANLRDTTAAVQGITSQANGLLGPEGGVSKNVSATMANVKTMTANLSDTTAKLNAIAGNIEKLSNDKDVQTDLKATLHNVKETTDQTTVLVARLNKLLGVKSKPAAVVVTPGTSPTVIVAPNAPNAVKADKTAGPSIIPRIDLIQNTRRHNFRMDMDAILPYGLQPNSFVRAGLTGIGDSTRVNLQYGSVLDYQAGTAYRYGLYKSKLSIGGDYGLGKNISVNGDVYDPNHVQLDLHGVYMVNPTTGVVVGGEHLGRDPGLVLGVELRR